MLKVDQQEAQGPRPVKSEPNFLIQQPSHSVRPLPPTSPAPRRPQQHCLACREGKQSFLMNHPAAFLIAFTSWAPNLYSSGLIPSSMYSVPLVSRFPLFLLCYWWVLGIYSCVISPRASLLRTVHPHLHAWVSSLLPVPLHHLPTSDWSIPSFCLSLTCQNPEQNAIPRSHELPKV